ncbi:hypothetical protein DFH07DRAFT_934959 [Mycena maculata]|uniref:Uncharacterized protein n=1 Tax=Mycena maculata TaxID=230809 RepID=A0AAD7P2M5_9AGAR|nr:hypothetical protein DFH07DRAFT_934959 [Mycena maculata]
MLRDPTQEVSPRSAPNEPVAVEPKELLLSRPAGDLAGDRWAPLAEVTSLNTQLTPDCGSAVPVVPLLFPPYRASHQLPYLMPHSSTKGFQIITYHGPPSPLAAKSRRFQATFTTAPTIPLLPDPPYCFNAMDEVVELQSTPTNPTLSSHAPGPAPIPSDPTVATTSLAATRSASSKASYAALEAKSQLIRQNLVAHNQEGKRTGSTYDRHYKAYITWFDADQAMLAHADTSYEAIPALPITAAKVTCFLTHEMQRPKKRKLPDGTQSTSTCGHEHAKQVVSALEYHRFNNQHLYRDNPDAQVNLRSDSRIKTMEAAFAENEPERIKKAHALKAVGTRADTYDDSQLSKLATSGLDSKGPLSQSSLVRYVLL